MKIIAQLALILAFILPYGFASADTHDDATMDVIEHSNSDSYENEIELPEANETETHEIDHDKKDETSEVEAPEVEAPEVEAPEVEAPEVEAPEVEAPEVEAPETH